MYNNNNNNNNRSGRVHTDGEFCGHDRIGKWISTWRTWILHGPIGPFTTDPIHPDRDKRMRGRKRLKVDFQTMDGLCLSLSLSRSHPAQAKSQTQAFSFAHDATKVCHNQRAECNGRLTLTLTWTLSSRRVCDNSWLIVLRWDEGRTGGCGCGCG